MATIAELKVIVDSSQIDKAKDSLKSLSEVAERASSGISSGMKEASGGSEEFSGAAERLIARVKELEATVGMTKGGVLTFKSELLGVSDIVRPLATNFDALTASQKNHDAITKEIARSQAQADTEKHKMLQSLREEITLYGKSKSEIQLYRAEQLGIIDSVRPLVEELNRLKAAKEAADSAGMDNTDGLTRKQKELELLRQEGQAIQENLNHLKNTNIIESERARIKAEWDSNQAKYESKKIEIEEVLALRDVETKLVDAKVKTKKATTDELNEFKKFRGEVDPTKKSLEKYYEQLEKIQNLRKQKGKGEAAGVDLEELDKLEEVVNRNIKTYENLGATTGKTAKEMAFSMRGLPAQFTDIAVSLQGGQKPLTVFLQQGGQIKDMFGGVGQAAKAMGGYVLSLLTSLNIVLASVAGLGFLAYKGYNEMYELNKALTLSGKSASISSDEINDYVSSISNIKGTSSAAISVLTQLVTKTNIHKDSIVDVSAATLAWSSATGDSIENILADFNSLTKDPVNSVVTLSEKYKFLTTELYNNIRALKEAGDEMGATKLATQALSESLIGQELVLKHTRSAWGDLVSYLGGGMKSLLSGFSTLFGLNKDDLKTLEEKKKIYQDMADTQSQRLIEDPTNEIAANFLKKYLGNVSELDVAIQSLLTTQQAAADAPVNKALDALSTQYASSAGGVYKAEKAFKDYMNTVRKAFDATTGEFKGTSEQFKQYEENRAKLLRDVQDAYKVTTGSELLEQAENNNLALKESVGLVGKVGSETKKLVLLRKELAELEDKSAKGEWLSDAEKGKLANKDRLIALQKENIETEKHAAISKKTVVIKSSAAATLLASYKNQEEVLREQLSSDIKIGTEARVLIKLKRELAGLEKKSGVEKLTVDEQSKLNAKDSLIAQQTLNASLEEQNRIKQKDLELTKFKLGFEQQLKAARQRVDDLQNSAGMGDRDITRMKERNALEVEFAKAVQDLQANTPASEFDEKREAMESYYESLRESSEAYYASEDEMQSNWIGGMQSGFQNFLDSNLDVYSSIKATTLDLFTTLQSGISESLTKSILYGDDLRTSMANLAQTIREKVLGSLIDLGLRYAINAGLSALATQSETAAKVLGITTTATASTAAMAASTAAAVVSGAAITAAYMPAAIAASIATMGGAAIAATASVATQTPIMAASISASKLAGFKGGGYTGDKGVSEIAGVVHGKEFVFDAESTSRIGVNNLEKIRSGGGGGDTIITTQISVNAEQGMSEADARRQGEAAADGFEARVLSVIASERRAGGMLSSR